MKKLTLNSLSKMNYNELENVRGGVACPCICCGPASGTDDSTSKGTTKETNPEDTNSNWSKSSVETNN